MALNAYKMSHRWGNQPAVQQLDDIAYLCRVLFAEHVREAMDFRERQQHDPLAAPKTTRLDRVLEVWRAVLPHRRLRILENRLVASDTGLTAAPPPNGEYDAAGMSDGERVVFYLAGQVLATPDGAVLVVDEPEVHVHRAVAAALWDRLEAERSDLAFVYLTHDLEFAASRRGARKIALLGYASLGPAVEAWTLRELPSSDDGFDEELAARVLGSRQPVLFVEGAVGSLDAAVWRRLCPDWSIVPRGGCGDVIHAAASFNANGGLHRMRCAGVVDADGRGEADIAVLGRLGVRVLPVAKIENVFLLPPVFRVLARCLGLRGSALDQAVEQAQDAVLARAGDDIDAASARRVKRLLSAKLKAVDLGPDRIGAVQERWAVTIAELDVAVLFANLRAELASAMRERDVTKVLALYDNKGLLADAARVLSPKKDELERRILGLLSSKEDVELLQVLRSHLPLPTVEPSEALPHVPAPATDVA